MKVWIVAAVFFSCSIGVTSFGFAEPSLKMGATGENVYWLQSKLQDLGYYSLEPDGFFGMQTSEAVMCFQKENGLIADGIAGDRTLQILKEVPSADVSHSMNFSDRWRFQVVSSARQYLGTPYVWSGINSDGFDCSGFVYYIFSKYDIQIPRMADEQYQIGVSIGKTDLQPGDLVFFSTYEPGPSHVGIYTGDGRFIHASSGANQVTITSLNSPYYLERYLGARRIAK